MTSPWWRCSKMVPSANINAMIQAVVTVPEHCFPVIRKPNIKTCVALVLKTHQCRNQKGLISGFLITSVPVWIPIFRWKPECWLWVERCSLLGYLLLYLQVKTNSSTFYLLYFRYVHYFVVYKFRSIYLVCLLICMFNHLSIYAHVCLYLYITF